MVDPLVVHLAGEPVAVLHDAGPGTTGAALEYLPEIVTKYGPGAVLLSVGLPVRTEPYAAYETSYFLNGLLPESEVRAQFADRARVAEDNTFGLLSHYGLDCAGAIQFLPSDSADEREPTVRWLTDDQLHHAVERLPAAPLGIQISDGVRSSLGGAQGKLALVRTGDRYGVPESGYPSTHILKPARMLDAGVQEWPGIVEAEAFAMRVVGRVHSQGGLLRAAAVEPVRIQDRPALLVERFDRTPTDGSAVPGRIHQEDLAQALGISEKYQKRPEMPPRLSDIATLLTRRASVPLTELQVLFELTILNTVLGNCDAHARNHSLVLDQGTVSISPAYDIVPTRVWDDHSKELALRINGEPIIDGVRREDLLAEAAAWGMRPAAARRVLDETLERAGTAVEDTLREARTDGWDHPAVERAAEQAQARSASYRIT